MATYGGDLSLERFWRARGARDPVRRRPRGRQRRPRAGRRPGDGADADPLPRALRVEAGEAAPAPPRPAARGPRARAPRAAAASPRCCSSALLLGACARPAPRPPDAEPRRRLAALGAERRRRLRRLARATTPAPSMTGWAMLGLEAAGRNPLDVASGGTTPVDFLRGTRLRGARAPATSPARSSPCEGAGVDPREFGGRNLVARAAGQAPRQRLLRRLAELDRLRGDRAARAPGRQRRPRDSLDWLREVQNEDGGWGDVPGSPSNADGDRRGAAGALADSKAVAAGGLLPAPGAAQGRRLPARRQRRASTPSRRRGRSRGILAAGGDPDSFRRGGKSAPPNTSPTSQAGDGHYRYSKSSDQTPVWVTGLGVMAAAGKVLPDPAGPDARRSRRRADARPAAPIPGLTPGDAARPWAACRRAPAPVPSPGAASGRGRRSDRRRSDSGAGPGAGGAAAAPAVPARSRRGPSRAPSRGPPRLLTSRRKPPNRERRALQRRRRLRRQPRRRRRARPARRRPALRRRLGGRRLWMRWRYGL